MKKIVTLFSLCLIIYSCSSSGGGDDVLVDPCGVPTQISTINITTESVTVNWTATESNASYQIEYGPTGFSQGNGQTLTASGGSASITGLTPATTYQFYVRSNCGSSNFSDWIGPLSFTTAQIDCPEAANVDVTSVTENTANIFWSWIGDEEPLWLFEYGPTGFTPGTGTEINVSGNSTFIENLTADTTYDFYITGKCSDTNLSDTNGPNSFTTDPLCAAPFDLQAGGLGFCDLDLYWNGNGETSWEIEYGLAGFTIGTGTTITTSVSSGFNIDNLFPGVTYEFYVRANCGSDGYSEYSDALVVTTVDNVQGDWVIDMTDSFGDGWQTDDANGGSGLTLTITLLDGTQTTFEVGMCSPYSAAQGTFLGGSDCTGPASTSFFSASEIISIPSNVVNMVWNFPGDNYGEIGFEIRNPDNTLVYSVATGQQTAGEFTVDNCN